MKTLGACGTLAVAVVLATAAPATAQDEGEFTGETVSAAVTSETTDTCRDPDVAPLLAAHDDEEMYFVAPGGDFEDGAEGWKLEGGASIGFGSSAFAPLGASDRSLALPAGSAATSPAFCVDERYPKFRVSVGQLGSENAKVRVSVVYPGLEKNVRKEKDISADHKHRWRLSKALDVKPTHGRKQNGWRLVALRFEVEKADVETDTRIDEILVDPKMRS